ncbi:hypothetical protein [Solimonas terrae]|uniref:Carrier domain-containing protein n=1 Tax=Solimonas terrae TaxID=1396819 RepID=A0A6M2BTS0_9GAMM|nr:hypothetical protein [Solimonas terrae]NGY05611.1 hypothetical protein [Solimonas terrae]
MDAINEGELKRMLGDHWDCEMGKTEDGEESPFPVDSGMDSVSAVHVLAKVMEHSGAKKIPVTVIRKGGYVDKDDFVSTLSASLMTFFAGTKKH